MKTALCSAILLASSTASAAVPINGWYSGVFGGYSHLSADVSTRFDGDFYLFDPSFKNGFNVGGRLGYQAAPLRYELEYTYIQAETQSFFIRSLGDFFNPTKLTGANGNANANVGMANIYFDFSDTILPSVSPFLGGGIGYAYIQVSLNKNGLFDILPPIDDAVFFKRSASSFAYQGTAGLTFNFAENFGLSAAYRYLGTTNSGTFGRTFQAQMGDVGIVYRFDQCNYK